MIYPNDGQDGFKARATKRPAAAAASLSVLLGTCFSHLYINKRASDDDRVSRVPGRRPQWLTAAQQHRTHGASPA
jgi:hypothetical protein